MADVVDRAGEQDRRTLPATAPDPAVTATRDQVLATFEQHRAELTRFLLGVCRDADLVSDLMQATLSRGLELGHTAQPETLKGWLFKVAFHEALAVRRRQKSGGSAGRRLADIGRAAASLEGPAESVIRAETADRVRQALNRLPDDQRNVVVARVYHDKTYAVIAAESGLPLGTVLTRMRLALNKLRLALRNEGSDR